MKRSELAPIVLFVYNRLDHTKLTIDALKKNQLAEYSDLFIYSDAPKSYLEKKRVDELRNYISNINGFKSITVFYQDENQGLAKSIIEGVTKIIKHYGKIIVLEDDIVTSKYFLNFMNDCLEFYKDDEKIWHINGWNYPIDVNGTQDVFIWRGMECWGWATWSDKWNYFSKNTEELIKSFSKKEIHRFNLDGCRNNWKQVILNRKGRLDTWAVYWYATIFKNTGLSVSPVKSFTKNIGLDGSGENCSSFDIYGEEINNSKRCNLIYDDYENNFFVDKIKLFSKNTKPSLATRVLRKMKLKKF